MNDWEKKRIAEWRFKSLLAQLRYHKFMYYVVSEPEITDSEYDSLERQFVNACEELKKYRNMYTAMGKPKLWIDSTDYEGRPRVLFPWKVKRVEGK